MAIDGLITLRSSHGPEEKMNRLEARVRSSGLEVMAHIDHAASAARAGMLLRSTDLLVFGAASFRTPHAGEAGGRHRPAAQSPGLVGRDRRHLARLQ